MKFQPNINEINLHYFFKERKYSTCSVYRLFINFHRQSQQRVIQGNQNLSAANFLHCTIVGQMITMDINHL